MAVEISAAETSRAGVSLEATPIASDKPELLKEKVQRVQEEKSQAAQIAKEIRAMEKSQV